MLNKINNKEVVHIPFSSEKGDCPYCNDGVLFYDEEAEQKLAVKEVYQCDICSRFYIEGINIRDWSTYTNLPPRRSFIDVQHLSLR
jgi:uncharacterized protein with PIN domain